MSTPRRSLWRVILAADPDHSLTETLGLVEAEDEADAVRDVLQHHYSTSPHELAYDRHWSPLADGEPGGPLIYAEPIAGGDLPPEEALELVEWALGDIRALQALDEFALNLIARALLWGFGQHPPVG